MKLLDVLFLVHRKKSLTSGLCPTYNIEVCTRESELFAVMSCSNCPLQAKRSYHDGMHIVRELNGIQFDNQIE